MKLAVAVFALAVPAIAAENGRNLRWKKRFRRPKSSKRGNGPKAGGPPGQLCKAVGFDEGQCSIVSQEIIDAGVDGCCRYDADVGCRGCED